MNKANTLLAVGLFAVLSSCTALTDCECTVKDAKTSKVTTYDEYDHDGSCSDFNETNVKCTAK